MDLVVDWQVTQPAILPRHLSFQWTNGSLSTFLLIGVAAYGQTVSDLALKQTWAYPVPDPHWWINTLYLWFGPALRKTEYIQRFLQGTVSLPVASTLTESAPINITFVLPASSSPSLVPVYVPRFTVYRYYDENQMLVSALTSLAIRIRWMYPGHEYYSVEPVYGTSTTVTLQNDAGALVALRSATSLSVTVVDAFSTIQPRFPAYQGNEGVLVGMALICTAVALALVYPYFWYTIHANTNKNNGLPPIFFESSRDYRGW
eukprot:CAMPEP_0196662614 /NCGR_PEP_ID=MMETSP1086-20130531/49550_1 /TAXON_ID=77921 /ORGANISM="Cyanoptyche  gloeocystis , Strain SAG4.97" /LENGTH=259 /DNA_ID=CAMNT_0041998103 /DNA_START=162 /DNA_END=941 /DNA_ORIENTATION=+